MSKCIVVQGNGPVLLSMEDIEALDVLAIKCTTVDKQTSRVQITRKQTDGCFPPGPI